MIPVVFIQDRSTIGKGDLSKISLGIVVVRNPPSVFGRDFRDHPHVVVQKGAKISIGTLHVDQTLFVVEKGEGSPFGIDPFFKKTPFKIPSGAVDAIENLFFNIGMKRIGKAAHPLLIEIVEFGIVFREDFPPGAVLIVTIRDDGSVRFSGIEFALLLNKKRIEAQFPTISKIPDQRLLTIVIAPYFQWKGAGEGKIDFINIKSSCNGIDRIGHTTEKRFVLQPDI